MKRPPCDWSTGPDERCADLAAVELEAQWTIADFGSWFACTQHVVDVQDALRARRVDGQQLLELHTRWFED